VTGDIWPNLFKTSRRINPKDTTTPLLELTIKIELVKNNVRNKNEINIPITNSDFGGIVKNKKSVKSQESKVNIRVKR
jgi:hypothetical protein